jgi:hypothetical protein
MAQCILCNFKCEEDLCKRHKKLYVFDACLNGYRLKKRSSGSRYTQAKYHKTEITLTKILEKRYGKKNIITSFHPLWAVSTKGVLLEYDIYIKSKDILVEVSGEQHYEWVKFFHKTKLEFLQQQRRDKSKARLAKKNGKKLIIFKYDEPLFKDYIINKIEGDK